jgi:hypothetical protein
VADVKALPSVIDVIIAAGQGTVCVIDMLVNRQKLRWNRSGEHALAMLTQCFAS